jgi:hypothetical protein
MTQANPMPVVPPQPPAGSGSNLYRNLLITVVAVLVLALVVTLAIVLLRPDGAEAAVRTEPIGTANDPFAPPVGTDQSVPPVRTAQPVTVQGGHVGLYGGTLRKRVCDKRQLVTYLQQHPDKGAAWAGVLGISTTQISTYVDRLTPVLLRSDTLVTNHGFAGGRATTIVSLLQAGTAVLVDDKGMPVTKCYCGNPLTPPPDYSPAFEPVYEGPRWPGFSQTSITIVQSSTTIIQNFTLVDHDSGRAFTRPVATDGGADAPVGAPATTQPPATQPPATQPPATQPPATQPPQPTVPPGPTAEERARAKVERAAAECYPFPAPIKDSTSSDVSFQSSTDGRSFALRVVTRTTDGGTQVFTWMVDRATLRFTPTNGLATVASNHCALLR